jgi:hypothetical protein
MTASIDPYGFTDWSTGTRDEICMPGDQLRPGTAELRDLVIDLFGTSLAATKGAMGVSPVAVCRTIRVSATCPTAGSEIGSPPDFSACWSGHASGAAIDVYVHGGAGAVHTPSGDATGASIVGWLLEPVSGLVHLRARQLGVQEITFGDNTWTSNRVDDRSIVSWAELDVQNPSGVAEHGDHVHVTLNHAGAAGLTGGYAAATACLDGTGTLVPLLRGLTEQEATSALVGLGVGSIEGGIRCTDPHAGMARDLVTGSDPSSASIVEPGDLVELFFAPPETVRRGATGPLVQELQQRLLEVGFDPMDVEGNFGDGTEAAAKAYQTARGLGVDGIVGCMTWSALLGE